MFGDKRLPDKGNESPERTNSASEASEAGSEQREPVKIVLEEIIRPLAIAGMLTCLAISFAQFINAMLPSWPGRLFSYFIFFVCLESIHAQRLLPRLYSAAEDRLRFRFVEWVILILVVRFGVYLHYGQARLLSDVAAWTEDMSTFLDVGFVVNVILVAIFWTLALFLSQAMYDLETAPIERMPAVTDPDYYLRSTMPRHGRTDRQAILQRMTNIFFGGGLFLFLFAGLSRIDVQELVTLQHAPSAGVILNVLIYFMIGFLMISQARYAILKADWELQGIPVQEHIGRRWTVLALAFLGAIGLISALLPVNYSVGLIDTLSMIVRWIWFRFMQIAYLIIFIFSYLLGLLMSLLSGKDPAPPSQGFAASPRPTPPMPTAQADMAWWQIVRSLLFWATLTGVVSYSLFHFINDRWGIFRNLSVLRLFAWLGGLWQRFRSGTRNTLLQIRRQVAQRLAARRRGEKASRWGYLSLRRLSPREKVRYYYLSILKRSAQQGFGRIPSKTPLEYKETLSKELPEADEQLCVLTEAFVEARYSDHSVSEENASMLQRVWRHVKKALVLRKRRPANPSSAANEEHS